MGYKQYCKDYEKIENYEAAKKDNFVGWECHHRLETHTSDGERRAVDITTAELKALDMYYNRPASELIFLTTREHNAYRKGKPKSDETRNKLSIANKGEKHPMYGKKHSEETKKKMSEAHKMSGSAKGNTNVRGRHWYNNGKENKYCYECPEGFVSGMLKRK